jgi:hypothetical protein
MKISDFGPKALAELKRRREIKEFEWIVFGMKPLRRTMPTIQPAKQLCFEIFAHPNY